MSDKNQIQKNQSHTSLSMSTGNDYPLHSAAKRRNVEELGELLAVAEGIDVNELDDKDNTPLHSLLADVCPGENCKYKAALCTELLVEAGADMKLTNKDGDVPLYLAIKNEWEECAMILLHRGADMTIKVSGGKILAQYLMEKMPYALAEVLDQAVKRSQIRGEDVLLIDFSNLLQYPRQSSIDPDSLNKNDDTAFIHSLLGIAAADHTNLYQHPVTELFLRLKYRKLSPVVIFTIILHLITLAFYTTYIIYLYIGECEYNERRKHEMCVEEEVLRRTKDEILMSSTEDVESTTEACVPGCHQNNAIQYMSYVLGAIWLFLAASEVVVIWYRARSNKFTISTVLWFAFFILMPITLWPSVGDDNYINTWRYPIAAMGIWLVWALCIEQLKKIPQLAVYLTMFTKVSVKIVFLAALFFPLLVGFTIGFYVMGALNISEWYSFLTLISSIVGEPDYDAFFDAAREDKSVVYSGIAIVLFLLFLILMCVVFINFLLGLTINNLDELWEESQRSTEKDQVRLMYLFDRLKFLRFKIFGTEDILINKLVSSYRVEHKMEYILYVKTCPSYVPQTLLKKLIGLSMREDCAHHKIGSLRSQLHLGPSNLSKGNRNTKEKSPFRTFSRDIDDDKTQMMDAIRQLERQISALTKAFQGNNNS